jgi:hypothetical protein
VGGKLRKETKLKNCIGMNNNRKKEKKRKRKEKKRTMETIYKDGRKQANENNKINNSSNIVFILFII